MTNYLAVFDIDGVIWNKKSVPYPEIRSILEYFKRENFTIGISSMNNKPDICKGKGVIRPKWSWKTLKSVKHPYKEAFKIFNIWDYFDPDLVEIKRDIPTKKIHFQKFWEKGFEPRTTIFFDDRQLNILEVREEGVHVFYVKSTEEVSLTLDYVKDVVAAFKRDLQSVPSEMTSKQ